MLRVMYGEAQADKGNGFMFKAMLLCLEALWLGVSVCRKDLQSWDEVYGSVTLVQKGSPSPSVVT